MLPLTGMPGWMRDWGRIRALGAGPRFGVLAFVGACSASSGIGQASSGDETVPAFAEAGGASVGPKPGGPSSTGELSCSPSVTGAPVFGSQMLSFSSPARTELYTWVTDADAALLRADEQLFPQLPQPLFNSFALRGQTSSADPGVAPLATALSGALFANARFSWPEPWAIRSTVSGDDPGGNLLRIVLKPEAWVAVLRAGSLLVVDQQNQPVLPADAAATPTRVGAIFYEHDVNDNGPDCSQIPSENVGFRSFVVGNLAMVQEWSLGTQVIHDRLSANIDQLTQFFARTRACPNEVSAQFWNQDVVCSWDTQAFDETTEESAYEQALAIPNSLYATSPPELGALVTKLQGDLFDIDPLVVTPGSP